jgi:hypothetical protein
MHKGRTKSVNNLTKDTWPAAKFQDISNHNVMMDSIFTCCKRMAVPILFLIINSCNKLGFNVQNNLDSNYSQQRCYWQFSTCTVYKTRIGVHFYAESQKAYLCWWMNLRDVTQLSSQNLAWWRSDMWYQISKPVFSASLMQGKCKHATTS